MQHPSKEPRPPEEQVLRTLLVEHWVLHCISRSKQSEMYSIFHSILVPEINDVCTYLETKPSGNILIKHAHGDHR
jgi:hypothetical protein